MIWRCKCRFPAAVLAAAGLLIQVRSQAQVTDVVPPGTPGANQLDKDVKEAVEGQNTCSCSCCQATQRIEEVAGEKHACARMTLDSEGSPDGSCPDACSNVKNSTVSSNTPGGQLSYERFCFHNCLPDQEPVVVGTQCRQLTQAEQEQLMTSGGNGEDPAMLNPKGAPPLPQELEDPDAPPEPPQLVDQQALAADKAAKDAKKATGADMALAVAPGGVITTQLTESANPGDTILHVKSQAGLEVGAQIVIAPGEVTQEANVISAFGSVIVKEGVLHSHPAGTVVEQPKETGAMVAEASGKQAIAASMEARLTEAEAISAQAVSYTQSDIEGAKSDFLMVNAAKEQVKAAEVRAAIYAQSAAKAAANAEAMLKEIQEIPKKAAEYAAAEAKKQVQQEVNEAATNVAIVEARMSGPPLPVPYAEAAVNAAKPYYDVMNKAIAMGNLYAAKAHGLQDEAETAQKQSQEIASQAVLYQSAGYGDLAQKLMAQARSLLNEANQKNTQAQKDFAVAENVRKQVPNYQANAAAASARATAIANPAGQPPPAMAPKFLQLASHANLEAVASHPF